MLVIEDGLPVGKSFSEVLLPDGKTKIATKWVKSRFIVTFIDIENGHTIRETLLKVSGASWFYPLYLSADGSRLATVLTTNTNERWLAAWDVASGKQILNVHWNRFRQGNAVAWLSDNRTLAVGVKEPDSADSRIALFGTNP